MAKQRIVPVPVATPMIGLINASEFRWHIANHPVWGTMMTNCTAASGNTLGLAIMGDNRIGMKEMTQTFPDIRTLDHEGLVTVARRKPYGNKKIRSMSNSHLSNAIARVQLTLEEWWFIQRAAADIADSRDEKLKRRLSKKAEAQIKICNIRLEALNEEKRDRYATGRITD